MAKVVYNGCYGGFSLSREAVLRARELSGNPTWGGPCIKGDRYGEGTPVDHDHGHVEGIARHDPVLVQVVEELGRRANGSHASLEIEEIPSGTGYRIDEYDGNERVMTCSDYQWIVAP